MAAVRQFFNTRAVPAKDDNLVQGQSEDTQRKIEAKMQAMGYSISPPIPNESLSIRNVEPRPLHSKFSDVESHQHPLLRKQSLDNTSYGTNNSFDNQYRPQPLRSQTEMSLQPGNGVADLNRRSSFYEESESPALSPALNKHLALRPLETKDNSFQPSHQRRRSRSATNATDEGGYYGAEKNLWDSYAKDRKHKPRQESLKGSSKPLPSTDDQRAVQSSPKTQNTTPSAVSATVLCYKSLTNKELRSTLDNAKLLK